MHGKILAIALAMAPLDLPAYVLLWIINWLPGMQNHTEYKKVNLIIDVVRSRRALLFQRGMRDAVE